MATILSNLINPEVMADMIEAQLPNMIRFSNSVAQMDETLVARPGDTISIPVWAYSGDAVDLAEDTEGNADILEASFTTETVKKVFKAIKLTDEAILSGLGDPLGEAARQIALAIANKVDNDVLTALRTATLEFGVDTDAISYAGIVGAIAEFGDEEMGTPKYLFVAPEQYAELLVDNKFTPASDFGDGVLQTGVVGRIGGAEVMISNKLADGEALVAKAGAVKVYMKRGVNVEVDRDIMTKKTIFAGDQHYVAALADASKVVKYTVEPTVAPPVEE